MKIQSLNITILGLSITSSWGNGHATTFRALVKELHKAGHQINFLERDVAWYSSHRDLPEPDFCKVYLYENLYVLKQKYEALVKNADLVIVGSYVPEGIEIGNWVCKQAQGIKAFYDIDTPVTLAKLNRRNCEYLSPELIPAYDLYLSFTAGPILSLLAQKFHSPCARALYCSVDPAIYYPEPIERVYDLGYLGTYSEDRQPSVEKLLLGAARRWPEGKFAVAGAQYPESIKWPASVRHIHHLPPSEHRKFYNSQRFTLNITRADMIQSGYSPSVRLFEAAACGTPIISDYWEGLETIFEPDKEIFISKSSKDTLAYLLEMNETERQISGALARSKILSSHTSKHRAAELLRYVYELKNVDQLKELKESI